jgi:hypothetical protein
LTAHLSASPGGRSNSNPTTTENALSKIISLDQIAVRWQDRVARRAPQLPGPFGQTEQPAFAAANFEARGLLIDSTSESDTSRTLYCKEIVAGIKNFSESSADNVYHFRLASAKYSTLTKRLSARGIVLQPAAPRDFFARRHRSDRFDLALGSLEMKGISFKTYFNDQLFHSAEISATGGRLNIFSNPDTTTTPDDKVAGFPNYVLRRLKLKVQADTVDISHINVSYSEFNLKDKKTGTVMFAHTAGRFLNITNSPGQLKRGAWCAARLSSRFMGSGQVSIQAGFNQSDAACSYRISGMMKGMPLIAINPVTMPLGQARIKSGQLQFMAFQITGDRFMNKGTLRLLYSDLDLEMLSKNYHDKPLKTLTTNVLMFSHNNPDNLGGRPRVARMNYRRPRTVPFFSALWQTLYGGDKNLCRRNQAARSCTAYFFGEKNNRGAGTAI